MGTQDFIHRRFLLAVFVVSGFTGLIYESIWSHYLKLFLGHAAYARKLSFLPSTWAGWRSDLGRSRTFQPAFGIFYGATYWLRV